MIYYGTYKDTKKVMAWVLEELECSHIHFYLAGSRYCGDSTVSSDWDFYTEGDKDWYKTLGLYLHNLGFGMIMKEGNYDNWDRDSDYNPDGCTYAIYARNWKDGTIQISIVKDLEIKRKMYDLAMEKGWTKEQRKEKDNWNDLYDQVKKANNENQS